MDFNEPKSRISACIAGIPRRHVVNLGRLLGWILFVVDVPHRRIVRRNLQFAHPRWSRREITELSKRIFQNLGITFTELFQAAFFSYDDLLDSVRLRGAEHIQRALEKNSGLIIISAHLGNWEVGLQCLAHYLQKPVTVVVKKVRYRFFDRRVARMRTRFGTRMILKKGALSEMRRTLGRGEVLGLLIDQSRRAEGLAVKFFGRTVATTPSAALLARRCKSPVLPTFCVRNKTGGFTLQVEPALELQSTHDLHADLVANTQIMTAAVEKAVRRYPEQWLWVHKRWKKYYPDLYPEYQARRRRRKLRQARRAAN